MDWVSQIGKYTVEKKESFRPSRQPYLTLGSNPSLCVHTTEGSTVSGAWSVLDAGFMAPHFIVGENRIVQMRPLSAQGAALVSHNDRFIQVEVVGFAKLGLHKLTPASWDPLVALTSWLHQQLGIPLKRPANWDDQLPSGEVWASNNSRRQSRLALTTRGVFGHIDVPDQGPSWHWDPGSLNYTALFKEAAPDMTDAEKAKLNAAFAVTQGVVDFLNGKVPTDLPADAAQERVQTLRALVRCANLPKPEPSADITAHAKDPSAHAHTHSAVTSLPK